MAHTPPSQDSKKAPKTGVRRPWSAPQLLEYGHIGKLTQGNSGTRSETGGKKTCL